MRRFQKAAVLGSLCIAFTPAGWPASALEIQQPKGIWQVPGTIQAPTGPWQIPGKIQQPSEFLQTPTPIQEPKGPWIAPRGIQAVTVDQNQCTRRISVLGDALFDFGKSDLRSDAEQTLAAIGPRIATAHPRRITVNGYTDAVGGDAYNDRLSETRARIVRDWLVEHAVIALGSGIKGFGKRNPVAPNTLANGRDNPEGRQKNRRVEIEADTCG